MGDGKTRRMPMSDALMLQVLAGVKTETRRPSAKYGGVGDRVAFTEAHQMEPGPGAWALNIARVWHRADGSHRDIYPVPGDARIRSDEHWRPPMFMAPWASRSSAILTDVHPEPLHAMTVGAMRREGLLADAPGDVQYAANLFGDEQVVDGKHPTLRDYMRARWDAIYGKRKGFCWDDNPTVYVHAWRRVEVRP